MKKVLYITNIEVPYRVRFFNELAKSCDLTVLYESRGSGARNETWAKSEETVHQVKYLRNKGDIVGLMGEIFSDYDKIIVGCCNSPVQILSILAMRLLRKPFIINLDGEIFLEGNSLKSQLKQFLLAGAEGYLVAGEKAAGSIQRIAEKKQVVPYYFSSLAEDEIRHHGAIAPDNKRKDTILIVAQYLHNKGNDVVLEAVKQNEALRYKFIGMGSRTEKFLQDHQIPENVEVIPFLQKKDLEEEYKKCAMLVLPSRQECWGLVINEAASFGTPIVSTWGSGAAVEFLADAYPQYLAKPGDANSLYDCICRCIDAEDKAEYSEYLLEKSKQYTIEASVRAHLQLLSEE